MNKEEKSLLDELWDAAGLNNGSPAEKKDEPTAKVPAEEPKEEAPKPEEPKTEASVEEPKAETVAEEPKAALPAEAPAEKKKDIKFLVIYTVVFVIVISGLIGGSYMITSRIHQQMSESNENLNTSQSTLKNIQDENAALKAENAALKESNAALTTSAEEAKELLESVADMVEQDGYLTAALSAYIDGDRTLARQVFTAIDREKLSAPAKEHYDLLADKLGL